MRHKYGRLWIAIAIATLSGSWLRSPAQSSNTKVDVFTNRYDIARTGANLRETILHIRNVSAGQFGKIFERQVDGDIYAQPLVKTNLRIPGAGLRDVVYVATVNNSLYAFDADSSAQSQPYWHVTNQVFGRPVPKREVTDLPPDQEYRNFESDIGIVATPVIDDQSGTIYVVAHSKVNGAYHFRLHAFDLATGREKSEMHSPMEIQASYVGNGAASEDGKIVFRPRKMLNRPGLLLINDVLVQEFTVGTNSYGGERPSNIHGAPVVWKDSANNLRLYVWGEEDFLRAFQFDGRRFQGAGKSTMRAPEKSMPGGILALSANGNSAGSAILWASVPLKGDANMGTVPGIVRAFDAANVEQELWNSEQESGRDRLGMFAKFCPPVVANGKLYMATFADAASAGKPVAPNKLVVYGLLNGSLRPAATDQ